MAANASTFIWSESIEQLAIRWSQQLAARGEQPPIAPDELTKRARKRAEAARKACGLAKEKPLVTARQWETGWDPLRIEKKLKEALKKYDWTLAIVDPKNASPQALGGFGSENTLVIDTAAADRRMRNFRNAGLVFPVSWTEGTLLQLAEELFHLSAERLGHKPAIDLIDEVASHQFAQDVLGWSFSPWAIEFLDVKM